MLLHQEVVEAETRWLNKIRWSFLEPVVNWLEHTDDNLQWWKVHTGLIGFCLTEMTAVVGTKTKDCSIRAMIDDLTLATLNDVLPHFNALWTAMRHRDRAVALESARAAVEGLEVALIAQGRAPAFVITRRQEASALQRSGPLSSVTQ